MTKTTTQRVSSKGSMAAFAGALGALPRCTRTGRQGMSAGCARREGVRMVTMLRPAVKVMVHMDPELADDSVSTTPATAPEVMAIAGAVCEFMNREHLRDVANYVVHFGRKFDDLSQLTQVKMSTLDATGFTADIVSCDDTSHCVCAQERFDWPLGLCANAADVINALKHLSRACGLPADF